MRDVAMRNMCVTVADVSMTYVERTEYDHRRKPKSAEDNQPNVGRIHLFPYAKYALTRGNIGG